MSNSANTEKLDDVIIDDDCPEISDEQFKIMRLVLSHKGARGNPKISLYYQGLEETRVHSIKSIMNNLNMSLPQAMEILNIPNDEYKKYASVV